MGKQRCLLIHYSICLFSRRSNYTTWPRAHICSYRVLRISTHASSRQKVSWHGTTVLPTFGKLTSRCSSVTVVANTRARLPVPVGAESTLDSRDCYLLHTCLWSSPYLLSNVTPSTSEFNVCSSVCTLHSFSWYSP